MRVQGIGDDLRLPVSVDMTVGVVTPRPRLVVHPAPLPLPASLAGRPPVSGKVQTVVGLLFPGVVTRSGLLGNLVKDVIKPSFRLTGTCFGFNRAASGTPREASGHGCSRVVDRLEMVVDTATVPWSRRGGHLSQSSVEVQCLVLAFFPTARALLRKSCTRFGLAPHHGVVGWLSWLTSISWLLYGGVDGRCCLRRTGQVVDVAAVVVILDNVEVCIIDGAVMVAARDWCGRCHTKQKNNKTQNLMLHICMLRTDCHILPVSVCLTVPLPDTVCLNAIFSDSLCLTVFVCLSDSLCLKLSLCQALSVSTLLSLTVFVPLPVSVSLRLSSFVPPLSFCRLSCQH